MNGNVTVNSKNQTHSKTTGLENVHKYWVTPTGH